MSESDAPWRRFPTHMCAATVDGCRGTSRRCRMTVREEGGFCKHHRGQDRIPTDQCPRCGSLSWSIVPRGTTGALVWRGGSFRCDLCTSNARADDAVRALEDALRYAEEVVPGRGAVDDVAHFLRDRLRELRQK